MNKKKLGDFGETIAKQYLIGKGYNILTESFRCKSGEIDIIAQIEDYIVFIEVKTRTSFTYGMPAEAVNRKKQIRYGKIASMYILNNRLFDKSYRFDVIEIYMPSYNSYTINHIKNAFEFTNVGFYI